MRHWKIPLAAVCVLCPLGSSLCFVNNGTAGWGEKNTPARTWQAGAFKLVQNDSRTCAVRL